MTRKLANQNVQAALARVVRRRKLKAFLITSSAIFATAFVFWSMSVDGFASQAKIRLAIQNRTRIPTVEFENHLERQWQHQLSDVQLDRQIEEVAENIELKDPIMLGKNFDRVRKSLDYEIVRNRDVRYVDIYLTYEGVGSEAELELVNHLSEDIAARFATMSVGVEGDASLWVQRQMDLQESQQDNIERVQWLVDQLDSDIMQIRNATEELTRFNTDTIARLPLMHSYNTRDGQQQSSYLNREAVEPRISLLWQKLTALLEKQVQLTNNPTGNGSADRIQKEIDDVRQQLDELDRFLSEPETNPSSQPPFQNVAHRSEQGSLVRINDAIDSIDVISLKSTVAQLTRDFESQKQLVSQHRLARGGVSNSLAFPVLVEDINQAEAKPLGGLPRSSTVLGLFLLSVLAGSVVGWGYSPLKDDRGFVDSAEIEKKLRLPVISQLIRKSGDVNEEDLPLCNLVFQMSRLALLVVFLVAVFGLAFDPSVRETFSENPLYGLARIMWNLLGK